MVLFNISDFALTYFIARFGYVAGIIIIALVLILFIRLLKAVSKEKNPLAFLLSLSAALALSLQGLFYIVSNVFGITFSNILLPFISYGGLGIIINMILLGLLLSIHRIPFVMETQQNISNGNVPRTLTFLNGRITIDLRGLI